MLEMLKLLLEMCAKRIPCSLLIFDNSVSSLQPDSNTHIHTHTHAQAVLIKLFDSRWKHFCSSSTIYLCAVKIPISLHYVTSLMSVRWYPLQAYIQSPL